MRALSAGFAAGLWKPIVYRDQPGRCGILPGTNQKFKKTRHKSVTPFCGDRMQSEDVHCAGLPVCVVSVSVHCFLLIRTN